MYVQETKERISPETNGNEVKEKKRVRREMSAVLCIENAIRNTYINTRVHRKSAEKNKATSKK